MLDIKNSLVVCVCDNGISSTVQKLQHSNTRHDNTRHCSNSVLFLPIYSVLLLRAKLYKFEYLSPTYLNESLKFCLRFLNLDVILNIFCLFCFTLSLARHTTLEMSQEHVNLRSFCSLAPVFLCKTLKLVFSK